LLAAGLSLSNEVDIPDERLFENLLALWQHYGRQPRRSELDGEPSSVSQSPYNRRFGGWTAALKAFIDYANSAEIDSPAPRPLLGHRTTGRDPSLRLRWKVLQRGRFTCCACGRSPATTAGIELQVGSRHPVEQKWRDSDWEFADIVFIMQPWQIECPRGLITAVQRNEFFRLLHTRSHGVIKCQARPCVESSANEERISRLALGKNL
jgi:hypothetical protein